MKSSLSIVVSRLAFSFAAIGCIVGFVVGCGRTSPVQEIAVTPVANTVTVADYTPAANDWPGFRGPQRNGITNSPAPPLTWSEEKNVLWKSPVPGRGHASPVLIGDQIILGTALESEQQQWMISFDRATGAERWRVMLHEGNFPTEREMHNKATHANGTVAFDGEHLFVAHLNNRSITASAVTLDGEIAWQKKLGEFQSKFGYAPSPLVHGPYVILAADHRGGGYLTALHRQSGEIAWLKQRPMANSYSSPTVINVAAKDQLLISGNNEIISYDPATGEQQWSCPGASDATCGTIIANDKDVIFVSGGHPAKQTLAIRADGSAEILWSNKVKTYEPSMLLVGSELYAVTDKGIAYCWDSLTGKQHWRERMNGAFSASPILCDGKIYALSDSGEMIVFTATPDAYEELARNQLGDDAYASPALSEGKLYLRIGSRQNGERQEHLYCIGTADAK